MCIANDTWLRCDISQYRPHLQDCLPPAAAVSNQPDHNRDNSNERQQHRFPPAPDGGSEEDQQKDWEDRGQPFWVRGHAQPSRYRAGEQQCEPLSPVSVAPIRTIVRRAIKETKYPRKDKEEGSQGKELHHGVHAGNTMKCNHRGIKSVKARRKTCCCRICQFPSAQTPRYREENGAS